MSNWQPTRFAELLRKILCYGHERGPHLDIRSTDTLSLIARAVRRSEQAPARQRLVSQVVTLNVDDVLEQVVSANRRTRLLAVPVTRASEVVHLTNSPIGNAYRRLGRDIPFTPGTEA